VWSVPLLKDLTDKEMYMFAFFATFRNEGRNWDDIKTFVHLQKEARKDQTTDKSWKISNHEKDAELITDKSEFVIQSPSDTQIKFTEAKGYGRKGEKWLKTTYNKKTVYVRKTHIADTKATFGKDTKFEWRAAASNVVIAESSDHKAQIRITIRRTFD